MTNSNKPNLRQFYGAWILEKGEATKIEGDLKRERIRIEKNLKKRSEKIAQQLK